MRPKSKILVAKNEKSIGWQLRLAMLFVIFAATTFFVWSAHSAKSDPGGVGLELSRIGDASHLEFIGAHEWKYDFKKEGDEKAPVVVLRVGRLKPEAAAVLKSHQDKLIRGVRINEKGVDETFEISFDLAPGTDFFDYVSDQPSRLIVDFFPKEPNQSAEEKARASESAKSTALPKKKESLPVLIEVEDSISKKQRNPAGTDFVLTAKNELPLGPTIAETVSSGKGFSHGIFDGGDPEFRRFSIRDYEVRDGAVAASRGNFYIPYPMLELGSAELKAMIDAPPSYEILPSSTQENKEARIIMKLFGENKRALFLKTAEEFLRKYPQSEYDEIIRYMVADTHYGFWRSEASVQDFEVAMGQYLALSEKYPSSPIAPRTLLFMGYSYIERGDSFGALKVFQRFHRHQPESKHLDKVSISIAEAYLKLNRFDDAYAVFDQVEKNGRTQKAKEDAAYRKGDVFFRKKEFAEADKHYQAAIKKYPGAASRFPNAYFNSAEAAFLKEKFFDSLEGYRLFLQKFPDHEHGGYAMTRMGELLGILGADPKRAQGAFLESYFRYRASPGAGIARIRLLTARMPEMKEKEIGSALREIASITEKYANRPMTEKQRKAKEEEARAKDEAIKAEEADLVGGPAGEKTDEKKEVAHAEAGGHGRDGSTKVESFEDPLKKKPELAGIEDFSTLLIADALFARKEYDKATKDLIAYYQKNPQSPNSELFKLRIVRNLTEAIRAEVQKGNFIEALRRYSRETSAWLKNSERVDLPFYVGQAYEQAGVFKEADAIYKDCLKRLDNLKKNPRAPERAAFESTPRASSIRLRLAAVAGRQRDFAQAESELKTIAKSGDLDEREQIERAEVAADVAEARGQNDVARKYLTELIDAWKGTPELTAPLHLRIARSYVQNRKHAEADRHLAKVEELSGPGSEVSADVRAKAMELRGDTFVSRGRRQDAIASYQKLLEEFESTRPLASVRYRLGQMHFDDGDLKSAEEVWNAIDATKDQMWSRLAAEQMQGAKWQKDYKKYLDRIPAAADMKKNTADSRKR